MSERPVYDCSDLERILQTLAQPSLAAGETLQSVAMRWHLSVCRRCHGVARPLLADDVQHCESLSELPLALAVLDPAVRDRIGAGRPAARRARLERLCELSDPARAKLQRAHAQRCPMCSSWLELIEAGFDPAQLPPVPSSGPGPWPLALLVLILTAAAWWVIAQQRESAQPQPTPQASPSSPGDPETLLLRELTRLEAELRRRGAQATGPKQEALLGSAAAARISRIVAVERWALSRVRERLRDAPAPWQRRARETLGELLERAPEPPERVPAPPAGAGPPLPGPLEGQHELRQFVLETMEPSESPEERARFEREVRKWALEEHYLRLRKEAPPPPGSWQEGAMRELGELVKPPVTADNTPITPGRG